MTTTRIAGLSFDARNARTVRQTARIYTYTRRIRRLAHDAASPPEKAALAAPAPAEIWHQPVRGLLRRP